MRKLRIIILGIFCMAICMAGCDSTEIDKYSEEEKELMAEYAAGTLLRYSAGETGGLGNPSSEQDALAETGDAVRNSDDEVSGEDIIDHSGETPVVQLDENADTTQESSAINVPMLTNMSGAMGLDGFDVEYAGYEVTDVYPDADDKSLSFSMQASQGKELVILHYNITNISSEDELCDVLDCGVKFRLLVNGTERVNQQMTILLNELKSYYDTIALGETKDAVLVFEVDEALANNIDSLSVIVVSEDGTEESFEL